MKDVTALTVITQQTSEPAIDQKHYQEDQATDQSSLQQLHAVILP
jgi:hypothetical protein